MSASLVTVHFLLAVLLFFLINWLGGHSISSGYLQLSLFAKTDEAPAFNFLFRVLAPVVYLVLVATLFYSLGLDELVHHSYLVAVYYVLFRWAFNIVTGKGRLLNWPSQFVVGLAVCSVAYFADSRIIAHKQNLLPDYGSIAPNLWLVVLIFLYQVANKVTLSSEATLRRKRNYLTRRYHALSSQYGSIVEQQADGYRTVRNLAYAVMIYETFNRPLVYRWFESFILFPLRLSKSLGPMQVQTKDPITDAESVRLGVHKLHDDYVALGGTPEDRGYRDYGLVVNTLKKYNVRSDYSHEVYQVFDQIRSRDQEQGAKDRPASSEYAGEEGIL